MLLRSKDILPSTTGKIMGEQWGNKYSTKPKNIQEAVHRFCKECNGVGRVWEECVSPDCSLFSFRPGDSVVGRKERKRKEMSPERKELARQHLERVRRKKQ